MTKRISSIVVLTLLVIVGLFYAISFHNSLTENLLSHKFSFTFSLLIPYILEILITLFYVYLLYAYFTDRIRFIFRLIFGIVIIGIGCTFIFLLNPPYIGDYSNNYQIINLTDNQDKASENVVFISDYQEILDTNGITSPFEEGLSMVVLPGCSHCHERFGQLKSMSNFYPNLPINILVTYQDTSEVEEYREMSKDYSNIRVNFFPGPLLKTLKIHSYPTLIYTNPASPKELRRWSNGGFGSGAWDYVLGAEGL